MSQSSKMSESPAPFQGDIYDASPPPSRPRQRNIVPITTMSPSPDASISSDKENRSMRPPVDKGKGRAPMGSMGPPEPSIERGKRKRTATVERDALIDRSQSQRMRTVERDGAHSEGDDYDPDQDIEERREVRRGFRDLSKVVAENHSGYLAAGDHSLRDTIIRADQLSDKLKQTSDATIDARLLVTTAELSYKKTIALISGDSAQGVDLEVFISKCRAYMRAAPGNGNAALSNTQRRRDRQDEDEDGDMLNWAYLGRHAAQPHIARPAVPGFLLGPLSLEKRAKRVVVRKAALRINAIKESRPEVLLAGDIAKDDNANLSALCTQIRSRAYKIQEDAARAAEEEFGRIGDVNEKDEQQLLDRHGIDKEKNIAFFNFVINPWSFGQTVENMFYVSFLIRDGDAGVSFDDRGLPYLALYDKEEEKQKKEAGLNDGAKKNQSVLALDMAAWKEMIEIFDIKKPQIKHREETQNSSVGKNGWYA